MQNTARAIIFLKMFIRTNNHSYFLLFKFNLINVLEIQLINLEEKKKKKIKFKIYLNLFLIAL